jgi:hypothetical protein
MAWTSGAKTALRATKAFSCWIALPIRRHARPCARHPRLFCFNVGKAWMAGTLGAKTALRAFRPAMTIIQVL